MKLTLCLVSSLLFLGGSLFAQVPGMMTMQPASVPQGTDLGANNTVNAAGIALGNRVKLRGFVDFRYDNTDLEATEDNGTHVTGGTHDKRFRTGVDLDLLIDFSPVTAEVHLNANNSGVSLEQAFMRYSFNRDFNLTLGRQLTVMGMESDESTGLLQVSHAYAADVAIEDGIKKGKDGMGTFLGLNRLHSSIDTAGLLPQLRRNYVDGIRANFNNARFGLTVGLHNGLWSNDTNDNLNDSNIGIDIAAALMIVPGLEWQIGYAHEANNAWDTAIATYNSTALPADVLPSGDHISQFNTFLTYKTGGLTLGIEYDLWDIYALEMWDIMVMANYQFNNLVGLTFRYSHEDFEMDSLGAKGETDRFTLSPTFSVTDNLSIILEYSRINLDSTALGGSYSADEVYAETLFNF